MESPIEREDGDFFSIFPQKAARGSRLISAMQDNKAAGAPSEDTAVTDFLVLLEEHKKKCEAAGKYIEADIAKKRCAPELPLPRPSRRAV